MRQGVHLPRRGIEPHRITGAESFQELAALDLDLHAAVAGFDGNLTDVQNVAALAIVDRIVRHQAFAGDADAAFGRFRVVLAAAERPAVRLFVDARQFVEQFRIDATT